MHVHTQAYTLVKHLWKIKHTPARDKVNHAVLLQTIQQFPAQSPPMWHSMPAYSPCKDAIQIGGRPNRVEKHSANKWRACARCAGNRRGHCYFILPLNIHSVSSTQPGKLMVKMATEALKWGSGSDGLYISCLGNQQSYIWSVLN